MRRFDGPLAVGPFYFLSYAAVAVLGQFVSVYLRDLGLAYGAIGALSATAAGCGAVTQTLIGPVSDRMRKRVPFALGATSLLAATYALYPAARNYPTLLLLHLCIGFFNYTALTAAASLTIDLAPANAVSRAFAGTRIWGSIGYVVAMLSIVMWPALLEPPRMFYFGAVCYVMAGLSLALVSERSTASHGVRPSLRTGAKLLRQPKVAMLLTFCTLYWVAMQGGFSMIALFIKSLGGGRALMAGSWMVAAIVEIPFMLWLASRSDRMGRRPVLMIAAVALPVRLIAYWAVHDPRWVLLVQTLHGLTFGVTAVAPLAYMNDVVPAHLRASGQGLLNACLAASSAAGPLVAGLVSDRLGIGGAFMALALPATAALIVLLLALPESRPAARA